MAKKNITFRIEENLIEKLNTLRGTTSQNVILELLLRHWDGETTITSTSTSKEIEEDKVQVQLQVQAEMLKQLQAQVQLLVNERSQAQVQVITPAPFRPEPGLLIKTKKPITPPIMEVEDEDDDNTPAFAYSIDSVPEWQKRELTQEDFYGKVPEPITYAPLTWECEKCNHVWDGDEGDIVCPKCQSVYIDEKKE